MSFSQISGTIPLIKCQRLVLSYHPCVFIRDLLDDFDLAISLFPGEQDLRSLSQAINLSAAALTQDPRQLPGHLLDRLERIQVGTDSCQLCLNH